MAQSADGAAQGSDSKGSTDIVSAEPDGGAQLKTVQAYRLDQPPKFDGFVDEAIWESVPPATDFVQQNPEEGEPLHRADRGSCRI